MGWDGMELNKVTGEKSILVRRVEQEVSCHC